MSEVFGVWVYADCPHWFLLRLWHRLTGRATHGVYVRRKTAADVDQFTIFWDATGIYSVRPEQSA